MEITHYHPRSDWAVAERQYVLENERNWLITHVNTQDHFLLCSTANDDYLDVEEARRDGYYVIRAPETPAGLYSVIAMPEGSGYINFSCGGNEIPEDVDDPKNEFMRAVRDAARSVGVDKATIDLHSRKSNDLIVEGRKFFGCAPTYLDNGDWTFSSFIAFNVDRELMRYMHIPSEVFEGKQYDSAEDRVTGLDEHVGTLDIQGFVSSLKGELAWRFGIEGYSDGEINDQPGVAEVHDRLTSDEAVFDAD